MTGGASALFIGSRIYRGSSYGAGHPLRIPRVPVVMDLCAALGWLEGRYCTSPRAKPAALTAFHTVDYIAALQRAEAEGVVDDAVRARHHIGTLSNPVFAQVYSRPATGAGGVMLAAEMLAEAAGRVYVPGGGTHHGMPDRANGFCYLNDPVLGILSLRRAGLDYSQRHKSCDQEADDDDRHHGAKPQGGDAKMVSRAEQGHDAGKLPGCRPSGNCAGAQLPGSGNCPRGNCPETQSLETEGRMGDMLACSSSWTPLPPSPCRAPTPLWA